MDDTQTEQEEKQEVVDGEIVSPSSLETPNEDVTVLLSLEQLIKSHISTIDKLSIELKKHKEMLEDSYNSDAVYQEHALAAKEAAKVKAQTRSQIMKQPANVVLSNKIKSMSAEVKEKKLSLSDYLLEYQRMTGINEIEGEDGELREIVNVAKAIKRSTGKK